jgi:hypothetical protein
LDGGGKEFRNRRITIDLAISISFPRTTGSSTSLPTINSDYCWDQRCVETRCPGPSYLLLHLPVENKEDEEKKVAEVL